MEFYIMAIKKSSSSGIPFGNSAGRPANPGTGQLYSNGEAQRLELYTAAGNWENIVQEVPGVSSITGNYSEATDSGVITVYGTNFVNGAYATAIGTNGVQINASSTVYNSLVQLTATFTGLSNANEPYDIKITNPSNLFGIIPDALYVNSSPVWQTASGSLGTFNEQVAISLSATGTDSDSTITYALASGSSLPSGVTLNSSTGLISGTLPDISSNTTYNFTINASDGVNTIPRSFSITSVYTVPLEYLVLAGGGGGGGVTVGGGGGGGGLITGTHSLGGARTLSLSVGQGGNGSAQGNIDASNGANSTLAGSGFSILTAFGGGAGGNHIGGNSRVTGNNGGSGGGGGDTGRSGGAGTAGQGNAGGTSGPQWRAGGGGGAGEAGQNAPSSGPGGKGGNGLQSSITGTATHYAGGGGGASDNAGGAAGVGGGGIGGGNSPSQNPGAGTNGLGGGGGGARDFPTGGAGAPGGSGAVIIAYPNTIAAITTIPGTLTYDQPTREGYRVYRFTAGTGTITF
jgi:hypothetical protein